MMRKEIFILLAVGLLMLKSCFYMDNSTYFEDISYDSIPEVTFTTNFNEMDSIVISDSILFTYSVDIDTADLYYVDLYFSDYWIYSSKHKEDSTYIGPINYLENDDYMFTMLVFYKTNTGSLADLYSMEAKSVIFEKVVTLDNPLK